MKNTTISTDTKLSFGTNLKALRKSSGMTRAQLAELISYSEKSIEKWEMSGAIPPVNTICRLARLFHVSVDSLLFDSNTPIRYLLGIDGGGTKTEFLLTDMEGKQIGRAKLGASNPVDLGIETTKKVIQDGIRKVCESLDLREISVYAGIAGGLSGNFKETIAQFLKSFSFGAVATGSDVDTAIELCLGDQDGISLIMGTGIVAFAQKDGKRHRIGGWGYLLDKGGSGYNLGVDALNSALRHSDGRGGSALLLQLIEEKLQKPLTQSIAPIYQSGKTGISSFAPLVFEALEQGDAEAERILRRNIQEVCCIIEAGCSHFSSTPKVAICGGLTNKAHILTPYFTEYLRENIRPKFINDAIVNGAISLAKKNSKKEKQSC